MYHNTNKSQGNNVYILAEMVQCKMVHLKIMKKAPLSLTLEQFQAQN